MVEIKEESTSLKILKSIVAKSKLTKKDALELGKKINQSMHARYKKENDSIY